MSAKPTEAVEIPSGAKCEEASFLSKETYIPCARPAVAAVLHSKDNRYYFMCGACADHNVRNRGGVLVGGAITIVANNEPAPAEVNAQEFADSLMSNWAQMVSKDRTAPAPHSYVYASSWRACLRRMVYDMKSPDQVQPFSPDTLANFRRGSDRERELLIDLTRVGRLADPPFEVVGQQERFELRDRKGRVAVVGKVDARIKQNGMAAPVETKAWHPNLVARIKTFSDLFENHWTRSGAYQLLSYLYGSNQQVGFMLLDRNGLPLILPVNLYEHLDAVEGFLSRAEAAMDHVQAGTLPDFFNEPGECKRCPYFGAVCQPPMKYDAATILTDPELIQLLERRAEVEAAGKEYMSVDQEVKKRLRGVEQGIAGPFVLTGKWQKMTTYDWPDDLKKQYGRSDPKGKFVLTITKT